MIDCRLLRAACLTAVAVASLARGPMAAADEYRDSCDEGPSKWLVSTVRDAVVRENRNSKTFHEGTASEEIIVESQRLGSEVVLSQKLPNPTRVIPELKSTLWVRSERAGVRLYLHVIFPNQRDPRTGDILGALIEGGEYRAAAAGSSSSARRATRPCRTRCDSCASYQPISLDLRGSLVDRVVVVCTLGPGKSEIFLDDLHVGPLAALTAPFASTTPAVRPLAEMKQGQLEIAGRPRLTIMLIDHGEKPDTFSRLHANTVWIQDVHNQGA